MFDSVRFISDRYTLTNKVKNTLNIPYRLIYNVNKFIDNLDNNENIKLLICQNDYNFELIINQLKKNKINNLIINIIKQFNNRIKILFILKIICFLKDKNKSIKLLNNFLKSFSDYLIKNGSTKALGILEIFIKEKFLIYANSDIKTYENFCMTIFNFLNKIKVYIKNSKSKKNFYNWKIYLIKNFKNNFYKYINDYVIYLAKKDKRYLIVTIKYNIIKISINLLQTLNKIDENLISYLYNKVLTIKKFVNKNKLKLYYIIKDKNIKNLQVDNEFNNENKILSYNLNYIKTEFFNNKLINIESIFNLDWNYIYKNTNKSKKDLLIEIVLLFSKHFDNKNDNNNILINFLKIKNINTKYLEKIIKFSLDNELYINLKNIIKSNIVNTTNITIIKKFLHKIKEPIEFKFLIEIIDNLLKTNIKFIENGIFLNYCDNKKKINNYNKKKNYYNKLCIFIIKNNFKKYFTDISKEESENLFKKIKKYLKWKGKYLNNNEEFNYYIERLNINKILWFLFQFNFLDKIYLNLINDISDNDELEDCPICLEKMEKDNSCKLKCNHIFHKECIIKCFNIPNEGDFNNYKFNIKFECPYCTQNIFELNSN